MKLYVVQNREGKYFRPRGYGSYGNQWQNELGKAKFYSKMGTAKSQCTFWFNANPDLGCPKILEFVIEAENATVHDMTDECTKSIIKINQKKMLRDEQLKVYRQLQNLDTTKRLLATLTPKQKAELGIK